MYHCFCLATKACILYHTFSLLSRGFLKFFKKLFDSVWYVAFLRTCHSSKACILYNRIHFLSSPFFKVFEIILVNSLCNTVRFTRAVILYHILTVLSSVNFHFSHYHLAFLPPHKSACILYYFFEVLSRGIFHLSDQFYLIGKVLHVKVRSFKEKGQSPQPLVPHHPSDCVHAQKALAYPSMAVPF